jgi:hypothetical protein
MSLDNTQTSRQPQQAIPAKTLLDAFEKLESIIGNVAATHGSGSLQARGTGLANPNTSYSLSHIEHVLTKIFAEGGAALLMEYLANSLEKSYTLEQSTV